MKKMMLVVVVALLAVSVAMGQTMQGTPGTAQSTDTLGAHNNSGRGCAGCHAPHSGGRGAGGSSVTGSTVTSTGGVMGDQALWGTDVSLITSQTLNFGDGGKFSVNFGGATQLTSSSGPLISGIAVCLSCHDGNVSKGAMMSGTSYEWANNLLPAGTNGNLTVANLYGSTPIPTLLGNDGGTAGDYSNDHPVGPSATMAAVLKEATNTTTGVTSNPYGLQVTLAGGKLTATATGQYGQFVTNYGDPQITKFAVDSTVTTADQAYVVCTTCHNQHMMNVYTGTMNGSATSQYYPTYFFVAAPYNPGAKWTPTAAPSTTQFCRQCHFSGHSNEANGVTGVTTAY